MPGHPTAIAHLRHYSTMQYASAVAAREGAVAELKTEWLKYQCDSTVAHQAWLAEIRESRLQDSASAAEDDLSDLEEVDFGDRQLVIATEGDVPGNQGPISKLVYSKFKNNWICSYFWVTAGEWRLDASFTLGNRTENERVADSIAHSVTFLELTL